MQKILQTPPKSCDEFIDRILKNVTASRVKLADLCDNMNLSRIKNPSEKDKTRIKKYSEAAAHVPAFRENSINRIDVVVKSVGNKRTH